ncbi:MAG: pyridoxal-phosphate dependent enzyme [Reichenbachiella sp.]|uniref:1-aminocyclopropane-1-carboxylate deaminase/D-cysteine desulfhydrase n=1 Tax=Reichenbachiella sp. TaxID=2184521 RepID=UPI003263E2C9
MFDRLPPTVLTPLLLPEFIERKIEVWIKREDLIDPEISGNKWRKLKHNLIEAKNQGRKTLLTFGGAYSNHIVATAAACNRFGFQAIGIIRGDELNSTSNPTLQKASAYGMELIFVSRDQYKNRNDPTWLKFLEKRHAAFVIPEGGSNALALKGVAELTEEISINFDYIICPVGTGGTLAGIIQGIEEGQTAYGISCLKGESYLEDEVSSLAGNSSRWRINHNYHFGGYAKFDHDLISFINRFRAETSIPLDPIYTGKMMYGLIDLVKNNTFDSGSRIICVHTGGIQGIAGFNKKHDDLIEV